MIAVSLVSLAPGRTMPTANCQASGALGGVGLPVGMRVALVQLYRGRP
jgi:hypothetical protein